MGDCSELNCEVVCAPLRATEFLSPGAARMLATEIQLSSFDATLRSGLSNPGMQAAVATSTATVPRLPHSDHETSPPPAERRSKRTVDHKFKCPELSCDHKGTFPRQYELRRHIDSRHSVDKPYRCLARGCLGKGNAATAFQRSDKLTSHIMTMHRKSRQQFVQKPLALIDP